VTVTMVMVLCCALLTPVSLASAGSSRASTSKTSHDRYETENGLHVADPCKAGRKNMFIFKLQSGKETRK
jgi:hypothetical protein